MKVIKTVFEFSCPKCGNKMKPLQKWCGDCSWWEFPMLVSGCENLLDGLVSSKKKFKIIYAEGE